MEQEAIRRFLNTELSNGHTALPVLSDKPAQRPITHMRTAFRQPVEMDGQLVQPS